jgi:hypothetical protein
MSFDLMSDPIMALSTSHAEVVMGQVIHLDTSRQRRFDLYSMALFAVFVLDLLRKFAFLIYRFLIVTGDLGEQTFRSHGRFVDKQIKQSRLDMAGYAIDITVRREFPAMEIGFHLVTLRAEPRRTGISDPGDRQDQDRDDSH